MKAKAKSGILLFTILVIGIVLGALGHAQYTQQQFERIAFLRTPEGFVQFWENAIDPQSNEQKAAVRTILSEQSIRIGELSRQKRELMRTVVDSTKSRLASVLTAEQMKHLEDKLQEMRRERDEREGKGSKSGEK